MQKSKKSKTSLSSRCSRPVPVVPTRTNVDQETDAGPDLRVPALKAQRLRDAILRHERGRVRDEHGLEDVLRSGRGAGQNDGAGLEVAFDREVAGAVVAFEIEGVGSGEESVEGCVAVGLDDLGGVRLRGEAGISDIVGGVQRGCCREGGIRGVLEVLGEEQVPFGGMVGRRRKDLCVWVL